MLEAIFLGLIQGLTEFLPISSSAHIRITGEFLPSAKDPGAAFTAISQIGTELAVLLYFRRDILAIAKAWFKRDGSPEARLGNLIIIVLFAGYENFVSKITVAEGAKDRPHWMGHVDYSGLKIKLIGSLVAISVIELLKDFMKEGTFDANREGWRIGIHMTFVISGVLFALMDMMADRHKSQR